MERSPNSLAGLAGLVALALGLCALVAFAAAAHDGLVDVRRAAWPTASAIVERSEVRTYRPFTKDGAGLVYSVEARVAFGQTRARVASSSVRAGHGVGAMRAWTLRHPPGSTLAVRFDPRAPEHVVLVDPEGLPMPSHPREDLLVGSLAALLAGALLFASRRLRGSQPGGGAGFRQRS